MIIEPPKIDKRTFSRLAQAILAMAPHYTPEWKAEEGDAGTALAKIHAFITEMIVTRLNQVPRKSFIAFLDMLGIKLLPAQPSRVPVVFKLAQGTERDILVPLRTQASAAKTDEHDEVPFETEKNLLAVTGKLKEVISVDPLTDSIYVHTSNVIADDGSVRDQQDAFTLFTGSDQQEHCLYLGHKDLLNIKGPGEIRLSVAVPLTAAPSSLDVLWEYWGEDTDKETDRWISLEVMSDGTDGLRQDGEIVLSKGLDGEIKEVKLKDIFSATDRLAIKDAAIADMKNRWLRLSLKTKLTGDICSKLPTLDTVFLKTVPAEPVPVEAGFFNDVALDYTKAVTLEATVREDCGILVVSSPISLTASLLHIQVDHVKGFLEGDTVQIIRGGIILAEATIEEIDEEGNTMKLSTEGSYTCKVGDVIRSAEKFAKVYAFGSQPRLYDAFSIGSKEAFSKRGAKISLIVDLTTDDSSSGLSPAPNPRLAWEYWDGKGWQALTITRDDTDRFLLSGSGERIEFICPDSIQETEVFGQKNYWIRARIVGGDYGREQYTLNGTEVNVERMFNLPVIRDLSVEYVFNEGLELETCLSHNNLDFEDRTTEAKTSGLTLSPFIPLSDTEKAVYLGFDRQIQGGPVRIFFAAGELAYKEENKPEIEWRSSTGESWSVIDYLDETEGFTVQGIVEFIGPTNFAARSIFDTSLYWLRGALVNGLYETLPNLAGVFQNATWAVQAETIKDEIIGSGDGQPGQTFTFFKFPVMEGEEVRVKEVLSEEERQMLMATCGETVISEIKDATGDVTETWVLWSEVADFFESTGKGRHYTIDRATGQIVFGDGANGIIPPVGEDIIKAFLYRTGGGRKENVKVREIKSLKSAVPGIDKVMNPIGADGGANTATIDEMLGIGPATVSTRNRAVTVEDYQWLAREASRKVTKARCLPNRNREGQPETGWVTVVIVPDSTDEKPSPSILLKQQVEEHLEAHSPGTIASPGHIHVDGPAYVEMSVSVDLFVTTIDAAALAVREARQQITAFFHPLTGGPEGEGWEFGRGVAVSDVYALLEGVDGVDHVENLSFSGFEEQDFITIPPHALVANGEHTVNARLTGGG